MPRLRKVSATLSAARHNRARLVDEVRRHPGEDRFEISRRLGLSLSLTHLYLNELADQGWVQSGFREENRVGRKTEAWSVRPGRLRFFCLTAGTGGGAWERRDLSGRVLASGEFAFGPVKTQTEFIKAVEQEVVHLTQGDSGVWKGAVVLDGPVNPDHGFVFDMEGLAEWSPLSMENLLAQAMGGVPCVLSRVTARLEALAADHRDIDFLFFKLDGTPAFGYVRQGVILKGAIGTAGELSHRRFDENGRPCFCGGRGCLESLASPGPRFELIKARVLKSLVAAYRPKALFLYGLEQGASRILNLPVRIIESGIGECLLGGWHFAAARAIGELVE